MPPPPVRSRLRAAATVAFRARAIPAVSARLTCELALARKITAHCIANSVSDFKPLTTRNALTALVSRNSVLPRANKTTPISRCFRGDVNVSAAPVCFHAGAVSVTVATSGRFSAKMRHMAKAKTAKSCSRFLPQIEIIRHISATASNAQTVRATVGRKHGIAEIGRAHV